MEFDLFTEFLRSDGSIIVNKRLARAVGIDAAIMYSELVSKYIYFKKRNQLTNDGFFFNTVENMEEDTMLSKYQQTKAIKVLIGHNFIEQSNRGIPQVRHFKTVSDMKNLCNVLESIEIHQKSKKLTSKSEKNEEIEVEKVSGNNTNLNNTKPNKTKINNKGAILAEVAPLSFLFFSLYEDSFGEKHPYIKHGQIERAEEEIKSFADTHSLEEENMQDIILQYFSSGFRSGTDYNINHFANYDIMLHKAQECGYVTMD